MKKKILCFLLVCMVMVFTAACDKNEQNMESNQPVDLYWNVDRDAFVGDSSAGMNSRNREKDGFYNVNFAVNGEQVAYKVKKARLLEKIDSMDIMGLEIDAKGVITNVYDPQDITGGEVASMFYVVFASDETITVSPDENLEKDYQFFDITENTGIYNVTGMDPVGYKDVALPSDRIRAFTDAEGVVTHMFIVERYGYWAGETVTKYCNHCNQEVQWRVWEEKNSLPSDSAHWILDNKVMLSGQQKIQADRSVILDLNGYTVTGPDSKRVYAMTGENTYLAILDSSEKGTGKIVASGSPDNGSVIYIRYGTFELFGGTIDASQVATEQYASAIRVNTDCVFNMYNGTIIGGKVVAPTDEKTKITNSGYGGTIYVSGTMTMHDGLVTGGSCIESGGNIFVGKTGTLNIHGGQVENGTAGKKGGNIAGTGKINVYAAQVTDGKAKNNGGNFFVGKNGVLTLADDATQVSGGKAKQGGNIYIEKGAEVNVTAGTLKQGHSDDHGGSIAVYGECHLGVCTVTGGDATQQGGNIFVGKSGTLYVNSATVKNGAAGTKGGNIAGTGVIYLKGGKISNGSAKDYGGNLYISGTVKMTGGCVEDGKSVNGGNVAISGATYVMTTGIIQNGQATQDGGNVYIARDVDSKGKTLSLGKLTVSGGEIANGKATRYGGNIFNGMECTFNLKDGKVLNGTAAEKGGNINLTGNVYVEGGVVSGGSAKNGGNINCAGTLEICGGKISNGTVSNTTKCDRNIFVEDGSIVLSGGEIVGGVRIKKTTGAVLTGKANITNNEGFENLTLDKGITVSIGDLAEGAAIGINTENALVATDAVESDAAYFTSDKKGWAVVYQDGKLVLEAVMVDWTETDSLPTKSGKYRLTAPVSVAVAATTAKNAEIYLDLNGQTVTAADGNRIYVVDAGTDLTITDTSAVPGAIIGNRESDADAGVIYIKGTGATLNLEGGNIDASNVKAKNGAAVYVAAGATFRMNGGTVTGGTAAKVDDGNGSYSGGNGGNIYVQGATDAVAIPGAFHMTGGTVTGGAAGNGGNIFAGKGSTFRLKDGKVLDGTAAEKGGNISLTGNVYVEGGVVSGGSAKNGGNINCAGALEISGGKISDGTVSNTTKYDRNIFVEDGSIILSGGEIAGGVRIKKTTGVVLTGKANITNTQGYENLTLDAGITVSVGDLESGAAIGINTTNKVFATDAAETDTGYFTCDQKGWAVVHQNGELALEAVMIDWTETDSLPTKSGKYRLIAPVSVAEAATTAKNADIYLDLNGQTVTATAGNRIYVVDAGTNLTITDTSTEPGTIIGNRESAADAGVIYIKGEGAIFCLEAGKIDASNVTAKNGAAVYVAAGTSFTMNGGAVTGGEATETGGNIYVQAATGSVATPGVFQMNGGAVTDGLAKQGGNIYVAAGNETNAAAVFNLENGTISGGEATATAGNVAALGAFTMTGGEITGGICNVEGNHKYAANLYTLPGKNGCTFTMTGGTITGGVRVNNAGTITLGGTAKISGGTTNLTFSAGDMVTTGFQEGAEIFVNYSAYGAENAFGTLGAEGDEQYIDTDTDYILSVTNDRKLYLENVKKWTETTKLPTNTGRYRLMGPVTLSAAASMQTEAEIYLDLNGQTITGTNNTRIYVLNDGGKLTIDDTATGGTIICVREKTDAEAGAIFMKGLRTEFNFNGGTLNVSDVKVKHGAAVYVGDGATFRMNGGMIIGGEASETGGNVYVQAGEVNVPAGAFYLNRGTVTGGKAKQGGNIYVAAGSSTKPAATFTITDGTVSDGEASTTGGNVTALGVFTMTGGEISGGICNAAATSEHKYATNLYVLPGKDGCTFTMTGGIIAGGVRVNNAGTITLGDTAKITTDANGYGMYVSKNGATIAVDAEKPLATGAEIWLSKTGNTPLVKGDIDTQYQGFFHCTEGELSFTASDIRTQ